MTKTLAAVAVLGLLAILGIRHFAERQQAEDACHAAGGVLVGGGPRCMTADDPSYRRWSEAREFCRKRGGTMIQDAGRQDRCVKIVEGSE